MKRSSSCSSNTIYKPNKIQPSSYLRYTNEFFPKPRNSVNQNINLRNYQNSRYKDNKNINAMLSNLKNEISEIHNNIRETDNTVDYYIKKHCSSEKKCKNNILNNPIQSRGLFQNNSTKNLIPQYKNYYNDENNKNNYNYYEYNPQVCQNYLPRQKLTYEYNSNLDFLSNKPSNQIPYPKTYNYYNKLINENSKRNNYYCPNSYENTYKNEIPIEKRNLELNQNNNNSFNRNITPERHELNNSKSPYFENNFRNITPNRVNNMYSNNRYISKNYNNIITPERVNNIYSNNQDISNEFNNNYPEKLNYKYSDNLNISKSFNNNITPDKKPIYKYNNENLNNNNISPYRKFNNNISSNNDYNNLNDNNFENNATPDRYIIKKNNYVNKIPINYQPNSQRSNYQKNKIKTNQEYNNFNNFDYKNNDISNGPIDEEDLKISYDRRNLNEINQKNIKIEKLTNENNLLKKENENLKNKIQKPIKEFNQKDDKKNNNL